jgi:hypothetical protein
MGNPETTSHFKRVNPRLLLFLLPIESRYEDVILARSRLTCHCIIVTRRLPINDASDLMQVIWSAGATARLNCSLCQAGTYATGSGQCAWVGATCVVNAAFTNHSSPAARKLYFSESQH